MRLPKRNKISKHKKFYFDVIYLQSNELYKPRGFWYSCYNGWYDWILENNMLNFLYKYIHKINIKKNVITDIRTKDKNKLLVINNLKDFDLFNKEYGYHASYGKTFWKNAGGDNILIRWNDVSKDFGGIEICPYLQKRRYYLWYNGFDVASGCIWNISPIIENINLVYQKKNKEYIKV